VGAGVTGWSAGDRAAFEPAIYCYHCEFCRTGHHNVCANLRFMSMPGDPGFFRDYANIPAHNLIAIPPGLSARDATIIEPLAVVLHSMQFVALQPIGNRGGLRRGTHRADDVICLKLAGAARVWAVEPVAARRELARRAGADAVLDPVRHRPVARDPARHRRPRRGCSHRLRRHGRLDEPLPARRAQRRPRGDHRNSRGKGSAAGILADAAQGIGDLYRAPLESRDRSRARDAGRHLARFAAMITHTRPLDRIAEAFHQVERRADGVGKLVISA
jgi:L-iditol 2-dehydrogenase